MQKVELERYKESRMEPKVKGKSGDPVVEGAEYLNHCADWLRRFLKSDRLTVAAQSTARSGSWMHKACDAGRAAGFPAGQVRPE